MDSLSGKVAIITGAASGIGRATALALSMRGTLVVVADIAADGANGVAQEIEAAGGKAMALPCDITHDDAFEALKAATLDRFGRVDIVMNNAGGLTRGLPDHVPLDEWRRVLDVNLLSMVRSNLAFLQHLIAQGSGHIVNTASFAGLMTYAFDRLAYSASKAAVVQISEGLAIYLRPQGIGVTVLCPGPVRTNIMSSLRTFGPPTDTRGPGSAFDLMEPADVGEQVADAILANRFMLPTHANVRDYLIERAGDWDGFIDRQIAEPHIVARANDA
jgi:NAD(P)-dependent dehydrogenase (short-subunit alcohol dehydrogenase family)